MVDVPRCKQPDSVICVRPCWLHPSCTRLVRVTNKKNPQFKSGTRTSEIFIITSVPDNYSYISLKSLIGDLLPSFISVVEVAGGGSLQRQQSCLAWTPKKWSIDGKYRSRIVWVDGNTLLPWLFVDVIPLHIIAVLWCPHCSMNCLTLPMIPLASEDKSHYIKDKHKF